MQRLEIFYAKLYIRIKSPTQYKLKQKLPFLICKAAYCSGSLLPEIKQTTKAAAHPCRLFKFANEQHLILIT
jgi:hypothetical protein